MTKVSVMNEVKLCPRIDKKEPETSPQTNAIIIDFIALVRKLPLKELDPSVKTVNDFASTYMITGHNCGEIHIVVDAYREDSIKNEERERRGKSKELVVLDVVFPNQNVPDWNQTEIGLIQIPFSERSKELNSLKYAVCRSNLAGENTCFYWTSWGVAI